MTILQILQDPDPRLKVQARPVEVFDDALQKLISDMAETMYVSQGIGLAATQVGNLLQIFIVDLEDGRNLKVFINPVVTPIGGSASEMEGCLSVPGRQISVKRPERVNVKAQDEYGKSFEIEVGGLMARAIQHENDHLQGKLISDKRRPK